MISLSIGLAADFAYKSTYNEDEEQKIVHLKSGDAIVFGGQSRMIVHSVLRVYPNTMPGYLQGFMRMGRLNVTYRDLRGGKLDTREFPKYRVCYDDGDENSGSVNRETCPQK